MFYARFDFDFLSFLSLLGAPRKLCVLHKSHRHGRLNICGSVARIHLSTVTCHDRCELLLLHVPYNECMQIIIIIILQCTWRCAVRVPDVMYAWRVERKKKLKNSRVCVWVMCLLQRLTRPGKHDEIAVDLYNGHLCTHTHQTRVRGV